MELLGVIFSLAAVVALTLLALLLVSIVMVIVLGVMWAQTGWDHPVR